MKTKTISRFLCIAVMTLPVWGKAPVDDWFPEGFVNWWPPQLEAARLYQCWPTSSRNTLESLTVWTDKAYRVIAYGSPLERGPIPTYAASLAKVNTDAGQSVRAAITGHRVGVKGKRAVLQLRGLNLSCLPSHDD